MKTALCVVAGGDAYVKYAEALMESAAVHFQPTEEVSFHVISGDSTWPEGTMMRWHHLLENLPYNADFVYLIDADMLMVARVGTGILPPRGYGITATVHPGYVGMAPERLPYERRAASVCCVPLGEGRVYHCGGFVGGERMGMRTLARTITELIDTDLANGIVPTWHDESALNRALASDPADRLLSPGFCYPASNLEHYKRFWPETYIPRIVALDKTAAERGDR